MDMGSSDIRIALLHAGVSQALIARRVGVSQTAVHRIIEGKNVSHRIRKAISDAIGIQLERIWPSTYLYGGPNKPGRPASKPVEIRAA
jgi:lambda repressor-like predicted transcriptional regulator